jgi:hypothetical protein
MTLGLDAPTWQLVIKLAVLLVFTIITTHLSLSMLAAFFGFAHCVSPSVLLLSGCCFGAFAIVHIAEYFAVAVDVYARVTGVTAPNHDQL